MFSLSDRFVIFQILTQLWYGRYNKSRTCDLGKFACAPPLIYEILLDIVFRYLTNIYQNKYD